MASSIASGAVSVGARSLDERHELRLPWEFWPTPTPSTALKLNLRWGAYLAFWLATSGVLTHSQDSTVRLGKQEVISPGETLISDHNCVACHVAAPEIVERLQPKVAPILERVGARRSPAWIERFLQDPHEIELGTTMPDVLSILGGEEKAHAVQALTHFLSAQGGPIDTKPRGSSLDALERGRQLYHRVGCVACHEPDEDAVWLEESYWDLEEELDGFRRDLDDVHFGDPSIPMGDLAAKTTLDELARFLLDPLAVRPDGRMPSLGLSEDEAFDIAAYLLRDQATVSEAVPGVAYEYFEGSPKKLADIADMTLVREGSVDRLEGLPEHRGNDFAFRFTGFLDVPETGEYTFWTWSDDGSDLRIDGELIVDNDGVHPTITVEGQVRLEAGRHALSVSFFEAGGGEELEVHWAGPGFDKRILGAPFVSSQGLSYEPTATPLDIDPALVEEGRGYFDKLGCASCHSLGEGTRPGNAKPFADLDLGAELSCIDGGDAFGRVEFMFDFEEKEDLWKSVANRDELSRPLDPDRRVLQTMERYRCFSCHSREGIGGPSKGRRQHFHVVGDADLGDQGRFPPHLEFVGAKLRRRWIDAVMFDGASQRPYMETRMPQFGRENVGHLPELFESLDGAPVVDPEPTASGEMLEAGRQLVGKNGFGCIQCHVFGEHPSLGVPAVDLTTVFERTKPDWFRTLLLNPKQILMNSRMPEFFNEGKSPRMDILGGDPALQVEAVWQYLSTGESMMLPPGLVGEEAEYELDIGARPRLVGVFMRGVSPRTVAVGTPQLVHYAFDVENSRLAMAWRGRFFNARGTWRGRAGALEEPASMDRVELPEGVHLARLSPDSAWPDLNGREAGLRPVGRTFDRAGHPTFRYVIGDVLVEESVTPKERGFIRKLAFRSETPVDDLVFLAARGSIEALPDGAYTIDGRQTLRLSEGDVDQRDDELRLPVKLVRGEFGYTTEITMEVTW